MTVEEATLWGQRSIIAVLVIGGPPLIAALAVGLVISIFQAVSQINEMTLVFVPKIGAVFLVILALGGWMAEEAITFASMSFESIGDQGQ